VPIIADARLRPPGDPGKEGTCRRQDPELFYSVDQLDKNDAAEVCRHCPTRAICLTVAMETREPYGVWGALDEDERRKLRRRYPSTDWAKVLTLTLGDTTPEKIERALEILAIYGPPVASSRLPQPRSAAIAGVAA
jgi:WhiB family redox-sensing transcriptional regulator